VLDAKFVQLALTRNYSVGSNEETVGVHQGVRVTFRHRVVHAHAVAARRRSQRRSAHALVRCCRSTTHRPAMNATTTTMNKPPHHIDHVVACNTQSCVSCANETRSRLLRGVATKWSPIGSLRSNADMLVSNLRYLRRQSGCYGHRLPDLSY